LLKTSNTPRPGVRMVCASALGQLTLSFALCI
jgi:hypothetical protein